MDDWRFHTIHTCRSQTPDKHTASIELSNACRQFYTRRLKRVERLKETVVSVAEDGETTSRDEARGGADILGHDDATSEERNETTSLTNSMTALRNAMVSMMDDDLVLMRQLLTLNERIEELKWRQKLDSYQRGSGSSNHLTVSACMLTDHVVAAAAARAPEAEEVEPFPAKYPSPSTLSLFKDCYWSGGGGGGGGGGGSGGGGGGGGGGSPDRDWPASRPTASTSDLGSSDDMTNSQTELTQREPAADAADASASAAATSTPAGTGSAAAGKSTAHVGGANIQIQVNGFGHIDPRGRLPDMARIRRSEKMSLDSGFHDSGDIPAGLAVCRK